MRRNELQMWTASWLLLTGLVAAATLIPLGARPVLRSAPRAIDAPAQLTSAAARNLREPVRVARREPSPRVDHGTRARGEALVLLLLAAEGGRSTIR